MKTCPLWAAGRWYWNIEHCSGKHSSIHSFIYSSIQPFIHSSIHFAVNHYLHKLSDALRCPWPQINCFLAYWCQAILISIQQSHFSSLLVTVITDWKYPTFFRFSGAKCSRSQAKLWVYICLLFVLSRLVYNRSISMYVKIHTWLRGFGE